MSTSLYGRWVGAALSNWIKMLNQAGGDGSVEALSNWIKVLNQARRDGPVAAPNSSDSLHRNTFHRLADLGKQPPPPPPPTPLNP